MLVKARWILGLFLALPGYGVHVLQVLDASTGRGIALVEVCAMSNVCLWSDSNGIVAFEEPGWEGRDVFLRIQSHGYEHRKDFFGVPGLTVRFAAGGKTVTRMQRTMIAERLYRMTGEGIYRDSQIAAVKAPIAQPVWNASVAGLDTVMHAVYRGRMFWLFGDTENMGASLGNLATTIATSLLPGRGGLDPQAGVNLSYVSRDGFVKPVAAIEGPGLKWMFALMTVRGADGSEKLLARYDRMKSLETAHDSGIAEFDDVKQQFTMVRSFGPAPKLAPYGRAARVSVGGKEYFYFSAPRATPVVRVEATREKVMDAGAYEALECGGERCAWVRGGEPRAGFFADVETGARIEASVMSVNWNAYRRRWIAILQKNVGEVWVAEAESPAGPWGYAQKVIEHPGYTFYWPGQVAEFDSRDGRRIWIVGTYTKSFSPAQTATPRYDYNQIVYALNLDDQRLCLPEAVWNADQTAVEAYEVRKPGCKALGKTLPVLDRQLRFDRGAAPVSTSRGSESGSRIR